MHDYLAIFAHLAIFAKFLYLKFVQACSGLLLIVSRHSQLCEPLNCVQRGELNL